MPLAHNIKCLLLGVSKYLGLFHLARILTRNKLRILCYHGFSLAGESAFRPKLFMEAKTFRRRMQFISDEGFPVLPLAEALTKLDKGNLPACSTVITIDDGFYSAKCLAIPALQKHSFPATLYVTTYYCAKQNPIFRLVMQYMFWRNQIAQLDLSMLTGTNIDGITSLEDTSKKKRTLWEIIKYGEATLDEAQRCNLARKLAAVLEVDYQMIVSTRLFNLMNLQELCDLAVAGIDIQLHTHRHNFPTEKGIASKEILDNKSVLEPVVGRKLRHFCYPSGLWSHQQWAWLSNQGIESAMSCDPGLNDTGTPRMALKRFLDGEHISQIEFEAEMTGFSELLRQARYALRPLLSKKRLRQE
jgi:peptidoglycan/xylan/chitin deacetylase (PgdA/CDA1 family)